MSTDRAPSASLVDADRLKAFTDAVVAIAMTLLVLPIMEHAVENAPDRTAWQVLAELSGSLVALAMSFFLIFVSWNAHHRLFAHVEKVNPALTWLTVGWMATIVWMPIPTALLYSTHTDLSQKLLYTGTLTVAALFLALSRRLLTRHPELTSEPPEVLRERLVTDLMVLGLYVLAMVVVAIIPGGLGYLGMFVLLLASPVRAWLRRRGY